MNYEDREFIKTIKGPLLQLVLVIDARIEQKKRGMILGTDDIQRTDDIQIRSSDEGIENAEELLCPHHRKLKALNIINVLAYYHSDDECSCDLLNLFETSVDKILVTFFESTEFKKTPALAAALVTSQKARQSLYNLLSVLKGKDLAIFLSHLIEIYESTTTKTNLISELVETFGSAVINNLRLVVGEDYTKFYKNKKKFMHMYVLTEGLEDISVLVKDKMKEIDQTLDDIFF